MSDEPLLLIMNRPCELCVLSWDEPRTQICLFSLGYLTEISGDMPWLCRAWQGFRWGSCVPVCVIGVSCSHEISDVISCCGMWRGEVPA